MKISKNQLKTWNSQHSDIDVFSRLQSNFLQKFFRYNLIDYFQEMFYNVHETCLIKKPLQKQVKSFMYSLFKVNSSFMIQHFQQKVHTFYKHKSKSFQSKQLQHVFKIRYCNLNPVNNLIQKDQFVYFTIKIKAEIQKLRDLPKEIIRLIQDNMGERADQTFKMMFNSYNKQFFNVFIVYFGDINFQLVDKQHYETEKVNIFGKQIKLRIFTFFVSKQALLQTFRTMNKINNLDQINDLVIQFYELKRDKLKQKKLKKLKQTKQNEIQYGIIDKFLKEHQSFKYFAGGVVILLSLICIKLKIWK